MCHIAMDRTGCHDGTCCLSLDAGNIPIGMIQRAAGHGGTRRRRKEPVSSASGPESPTRVHSARLGDLQKAFEQILEEVEEREAYLEELEALGDLGNDTLVVTKQEIEQRLRELSEVNDAIQDEKRHLRGMGHG